MMRRSGLIHRNQGGFTLIEMVTVVALVGLISLGIAAAIMQILVINARASNHMIAVRQVQQAGKEVSKDTLQAQNVTSDGEESLVLEWQEPHPGPESDWYDIKVEYELVSTLDGLAQLKRTYSKYEGGVLDTTYSNIVARYMDVTVDDPPPGTARTNWDWDDQEWVLTFSVTATVGKGLHESRETRVYKVEPRPTPAPTS